LILIVDESKYPDNIPTSKHFINLFHGEILLILLIKLFQELIIQAILNLLNLPIIINKSKNNLIVLLFTKPNRPVNDQIGQENVADHFVRRDLRFADVHTYG
jgi:hypothetical protein